MLFTTSGKCETNLFLPLDFLRLTKAYLTSNKQIDLFLWLIIYNNIILISHFKKCKKKNNFIQNNIQYVDKGLLIVIHIYDLK